jgi:hypothetical protein
VGGQRRTARLVNYNVNIFINILRNINVYGNVTIEGAVHSIQCHPFAASPAAAAGCRGFGGFVRVSRNDHVELLHLIGTGEQGIFGFVIDATT